MSPAVQDREYDDWLAAALFAILSRPMAVLKDGKVSRGVSGSVHISLDVPAFRAFLFHQSFTTIYRSPTSLPTDFLVLP